MPTPEFLDYEPLRRPKNARAADAVQSPEWSFEPKSSEPPNTWSATDFPAEPSQTEKSAEQSSPAVPLRQEENEGVLKKGHGLTFAGLFLFMLVLYVRPYEFFPTMTWLQSVAFWLAMVTLAIFVPTQLGLENRLTIRPREVKLVGLLTLLAVLSIPQALDPLLAWNGFVDYLKVILMFVVLINVVRTEQRLKILFLMVFIVSCVLSIGGIRDYALGRLDLGGLRIKGMIGGMFDNPNDLALHLDTMIPIAVALFAGSRAVFKKLFYGLAAIVMTAGVVVTFSRGGFLALICMGAVLAWRIGRRNKWLIVMLLPLILVGFVLFAPGGYRDRLVTTDDGSSLSRLDDLKRSIFISAHHPLLGVGYGNYILFSNSNHATHNSYTQVSSELGLAAMVIYILFLISPIGRLKKIARETSDRRAWSRYYYLSVGLEASLIGYMVASFFASVAFLWYVYFLVGYAICLRRLYYASEERAEAG